MKMRWSWRAATAAMLDGLNRKPLHVNHRPCRC